MFELHCYVSNAAGVELSPTKITYARKTVRPYVFKLTQQTVKNRWFEVMSA